MRSQWCRPGGSVSWVQTYRPVGCVCGGGAAARQTLSVLYAPWGTVADPPTQTEPRSKQRTNRAPTAQHRQHQRSTSPSDRCRVPGVEFSNHPVGPVPGAGW